MNETTKLRPPEPVERQALRLRASISKAFKSLRRLERALEDCRKDEDHGGDTADESR